MKLTSIELTNFKAIGERVVIPVRPITLIFGANSAGKSSILQCLAMLAQSMTEGMEKPYLFGKGPLIDAGNFRDFIHEHNTEKSFECKFNFDMDVERLFDYLLPDDVQSIRVPSLNDSAEKFKKILSQFKETSLSFRFDYTTLSSLEFFLDDKTKPVFSYINYTIYPNYCHIFWEMYWDIFKKDIFNRLYEYPREVMEGRSEIVDGEFDEKRFRDSGGKDGVKVKHFSDQEKLLFKQHLSMEHNNGSLIELYSLILWHGVPGYEQLKEDVRQGKPDVEVVFKFYNIEEDEKPNYFTEF
jgi:energy-coupling factor transporter ATP-binding protein EcfA2